MMITRLNFPYLFPQILTTIQSSNFISLDLEMSGIISTKTLDPSLTDTVILNLYSRFKIDIIKPERKLKRLFLCNWGSVLSRFKTIELYILPWIFISTLFRWRKGMLSNSHLTLNQCDSYHKIILILTNFFMKEFLLLILQSYKKTK